MRAGRRRGQVKSRESHPTTLAVLLLDEVLHTLLLDPPPARDVDVEVEVDALYAPLLNLFPLSLLLLLLCTTFLPFFAPSACTPYGVPLRLALLMRGAASRALRQWML